MHSFAEQMAEFEVMMTDIELLDLHDPRLYRTTHEPGGDPCMRN